MSTKQMTVAPAPVFEAGDQAFVDCGNGAGERVHTYWPERDSWACSHCGAFTRPQTPPTVQRPQEMPEKAWKPPTQPSSARIRLNSGEKINFPMANPNGYEVLVRPFGEQGQTIAYAAHEVRQITFMFPGSAS